MGRCHSSDARREVQHAHKGEDRRGDDSDLRPWALGMPPAPSGGRRCLEPRLDAASNADRAGPPEWTGHDLLSQVTISRANGSGFHDWSSALAASAERL